MQFVHMKNTSQTCNPYFWDAFMKLQAIKVGVKTDCQKTSPEPKPEDIELEWAKIRPINTYKNFNKVHSGVFISNIERGAEFLKTPRINKKGW